MSSGYIIYITDTETTSLKDEGDIIELSMFRASLTDDSFPKEQKTWYLKALNPKAIEDEALKINGHKKEDILWQTEFGKQKYQEPSVVISEVENWVMTDGVSSIDRIFCGQNAPFDSHKMQVLWERMGSKDTFPFDLTKDNRILDTKMIALLIDICVEKRREFYNLSSLVKAFGVKKGKAHQASEDTRMTKDLLFKMIKPILKLIAEQHKDSYVE